MSTTPSPSARKPSTELVPVTAGLELVLASLPAGELARLLKELGAPETFSDGWLPVRRDPAEMERWARGRLRSLIRVLKAWRGQSALYAALGARRAAIEGRHEAVDSFARHWLKIPNVTPDWREAVSAALMDDWEDGLDVEDDGLVAALRKNSHTVHRQLQPVWERKANGRRVALLDAPVCGGHDLTLRDVLSDGRHPQDDVLPWEPDEPRALVVFASLSSEEQALARVWSQSPGTSWEEAALLTGASNPYAFGQRVRAKLKRLGKQYNDRAQAAALTVGGMR
ncbi:hypothetical protein BOQ63_001475 (plasmid) [Streptomyces viridifaciens]|nr:hypothetical protein BOQ63_001475 [Streptomyces viridifaciens]